MGKGLNRGERFRVILPLKRAISADVYNEFSESLRKRFWYSDASFSKTLQIQYLPTYNKVFEDQFKAYHNSGRLFDLECIDYVPAVINDFPLNAVFTKPKFDDDNIRCVLEAIIEHNRGAMEYEERRILANRLAAADVSDIDMISVLNAVSRPGARHTGSDMAKMANASYGHVMGLRKNLPTGFKFNLLVQPTVIYPPKNVKLPKYDTDITLKPNQYLSDVIKQIYFKDGLNLLIVPTGGGKNHAMERRENTKLVVPLNSIVVQSGSSNNIQDENVATWNQIEKMMRNPEECKKWDLVIDEAHGMVLDYDYKATIIRLLAKACTMFRKVILMSGTVRPEYFSCLKFETIHRVRKESQAKKKIQTNICKSKEESLLNDLRESKGKSIVLINDKDLGKTIGKLSGKNCLFVNADLKNEPEVVNLFITGKLDDYECIVGTNSIVEGLSITDELDDANVFILGDTDPDRIEQVSNRFRNVKKIKKVQYYIDAKPLFDVSDDNVHAKIKAAQKLAEALTVCLSVASSEIERKGYIAQYSKEIKHASVFYADGEFKVNYCAIDYQSYLNRKEKASNDFGVFSSRLIEYGYDVFYPIWRHELTIEKEQIENDKQQVKEQREYIRCEDLLKLAHDFKNKCVESDYSPEYDSTKEIVLKMTEVGLKIDDIEHVIKQIIYDKSYIEKIWSDMKYVHFDTSIRAVLCNEVQNSLVSVKGEKYLLSQDIVTIAKRTAEKVLKEFYQGDLNAMLADGNWSSDIQKVSNGGNNTLNIIDNPLDIFEVKEKRASTIVNRYICITRSGKVQIKGKRQEAYKVVHYSLTGLEFDKRSDEQKLLDAIVIKKKSKSG
ncbi:DEAD/DEAH box helicase family protein [Edaphovirga cremea]|uniref:DEAD/DEAH box helicase family protein n=1 Tax=Edaphovirga cremea TaxID=2267246 RepID=UPI000DEF6576|nr:DEAD/DEAH box helicase family protein [Edaphovirga cremea]